METPGLSEKILQYLGEHESVDTYEFSKLLNEDHQKIIGAVKRLQSQDDLIIAEPCSRMEWILTDEGQQVAKDGSHEVLVFQAVPLKGILKDDLMKKVPSSVGSIGLSKAMANRWIHIDKSCNPPLIMKKVDSVQDIVQEHLSSILDCADSLDTKIKLDYKKRKLIQEVVTKSFNLRKGHQFSLSLNKAETDLTPEMIASGSWKDKTFKAYNFDALGVPPVCGTLHPLLKVRTEFRQIFLEMGFTEMPTNNYIESSFWNFDALFQPQQHPARDAHDTFFISSPQQSTDFPQAYLERVKSVHSSGGYGSQGYRYDWKLEEAQKNLLRTHTTAVSARMLYNLAQSGFKPAKYFSIDRVFRNETLDATHLAEFHQVEGVVADYNLSLGNLIGVLHEFFNKLGLKSLKFKPAYNPYTEPSMEIFSYHPGLGKWIEVGNSGIFRPEMLRPMGLPEDVHVIAWGLSLERPTMIKYGYNNIRDLVGPKVDLQMVKDSPVCRLAKENMSTKQFAELENRLEAVINILQSSQLTIQAMKPVSLENMTHDKVPHRDRKCLNPSISKRGGENINQVASSKDAHRVKIPESLVMINETQCATAFRDVVIEADPQYPPYTLPIMLQALGPNIVSGSIHVHSSVVSMQPDLENFCKNSLNQNNGRKPLNIVLIWRDIGRNPVIIRPYINCIRIIGEVNIIRYLDTWEGRGKFGCIHFIHAGRPTSQSDNILMQGQLDAWLDRLHQAFVCGKATKAVICKLESALEGREWLVGSRPTVADIFMWSVYERKSNIKFPQSLQAWITRCCQFISENSQ